jgi:hypothetical protein
MKWRRNGPGDYASDDECYAIQRVGKRWQLLDSGGDDDPYFFTLAEAKYAAARLAVERNPPTLRLTE